jgi:hypothetical protein
VRIERLSGQAAPIDRGDFLVHQGLIVNPARCLRSLVTEAGWRLTIFPGEDYGEMFHLLDDPNEQRNVYRDEAYADTCAALMQRLVEQLNEYIDDGYAR